MRSGGTSCGGSEYRPEAWNLQAREKFAEQRYGVFIVWGLYAYYAQGECYMLQRKIDRDAYERIVDGFYPSKFNAREWVRIVRRSGAKYITVTARHCDGFALWPSKVDDGYNIAATPFKRDVIGELAEACKAEGIQLNLYYSLMDWHRRDYPLGRSCKWLKAYAKDQKPDYASYKRYMLGQITELLDNYHPGNIWFDCECDQYDRDRGGTFDWGFDEIFDLIHSRQVLVANNNHRAPRPKEDIQLFERDLPGVGTMFSKHQPHLDDRPSEQCDVIQYDVWGYQALERMAALGAWLKVNGEAIYETRPLAPYRKGDWAFTRNRRTGAEYAIRLWKEGEAKTGRQRIPDVTTAKLVHIGSGRAVALRPPSPATGKSFDCAKAAGGVEFELPADFKADANADVFRIVH